MYNSSFNFWKSGFLLLIFCLTCTWGGCHQFAVFYKDSVLGTDVPEGNIQPTHWAHCSPQSLLPTCAAVCQLGNFSQDPRTIGDIVTCIGNTRYVGVGLKSISHSVTKSCTGGISSSHGGYLFSVYKKNTLKTSRSLVAPLTSCGSKCDKMWYLRKVRLTDFRFYQFLVVR